MTTQTGARDHHIARFRKLSVKLAVMCAAALLIGGCVIPKHRGVVMEPPLPPPANLAEHFAASMYRLSEGDTLEFLYLTRPQKAQASYKLAVKDLIDIEFNYHPELNRTVRVRPDGKISIPRKTDVVVAGRTPDDVSAMLRDIYKDLLKDPEITVTVREFNAKMDELQKAIATAPYGQARLVTIRPDGFVSVPYIADVRAAGLTVGELTDTVNKKYKDIIEDMSVSVLLRDVIGNLIYVDGEVAKPGVFTMKGPMSVQHAIAMAGGTIPSAEPRTVLVMTKAPDGRVLPRTVDLTHMNAASDAQLCRNDLVYVPRSLISRADIWVDQNIRQLLTWTGWNLGLTTQVGRQTTR
jgi:protein involved in polysaccharide export with SLBB domain